MSDEIETPIAISTETTPTKADAEVQHELIDPEDKSDAESTTSHGSKKRKIVEVSKYTTEKGTVKITHYAVVNHKMMSPGTENIKLRGAGDRVSEHLKNAVASDENIIPDIKEDFGVDLDVSKMTFCINGSTYRLALVKESVLLENEDRNLEAEFDMVPCDLAFSEKWRNIKK